MCQAFPETDFCISLRFLAQPLNGGNNSGRNFCDRPVSIHFRETSRSPVVLNNRRSLCLISAHALRKNLLGVVGSLDQRSPFNIAEATHLRGLAVDGIDGLADRTVPAP